ncbi:MAG: hypothetical protein M1819_000198 [Sarea resinae]|nr:MAG: hypothetical protein M1819_000198 [Sarea resinae]
MATPSTPASTALAPAATSTKPHSSTTSSHSQRNLTIILSVTLGCLGILLLSSLIAWLTWRRNPRRGRWSQCLRLSRKPFARSSITPIADEEIETWRLGTAAEKPHDATDHNNNNNSRKASLQYDMWSEKKFEGPISPTAAHAPNARYGLTDSSVPGAAPFVATTTSPPQRTPSKLQKSASFSRSKHQRHKSSRSSLADRPPTPFANNKQDGSGGGGGVDPVPTTRPEVPPLRNKSSESFDLDRVAFCQKLG